MRLHSYGGMLGVLIVVIIMVCSCEQQPLYDSSHYYYDLQVYINKADRRSENVKLSKAIIMVNKRNLDAISYLSGTYFVRIPFKEISKISFDTQRMSSQSSTGENWRMIMRIEARTGETITADSIPTFYVRGHQSRYVERILRNDANHFDIREIRILKQYDKYGQSQTQTKPPQPGGSYKPRNSDNERPSESTSTPEQPTRSRRGTRSR